MDTHHRTAEEIAREEWRPVVGFEGWYEVSDLGRVRRSTEAPTSHPARILKPGLRRGYHGVSLCKYGVVTQRLVHSLVAEAFIGPCPEGLEVGHEDNDRGNNRVGNLSYLTHKQNMQHCADTTDHIRGEANNFATTTTAQAVRIKELLRVGSTGMPPGLIAVCVGVSIHVVYQIQSGKIWGHLTTPLRQT